MHMIIKKKTAINALLIVLLIPPNGIEQTSLNQVSKMIGAIIGLALIISILMKYKEKLKLLIIPIILLLIETLSTLIVDSSSIFPWVILGFNILGCCSLVVREAEKNIHSLIHSMLIVFYSYIVIEILSIFAGSNFLYNFNQVFLLYPVCAILLLIELETKKRRKIAFELLFWVLTTSVVFMTFRVNAIEGKTGDIEGSFFASVFAIVFIKVFDKSRIIEKVKMKTVLVGTLVLQFGVVFTQGMLTIPAVQYFISNILNKPINLTGRTLLWAQSFEYLQRNMLWGYGASWIGLDIWGSFYPPHNQFLYFALLGGVGVLIVFCIWMVAISKQVDQANEHKDERVAKIFAWGWLGLLVSLSFLSYGYKQMLPIFSLMMLSWQAPKALYYGRNKDK